MEFELTGVDVSEMSRVRITPDGIIAVYNETNPMMSPLAMRIAAASGRYVVAHPDKPPEDGHTNEERYAILMS
jgi:hypothetical protein